MVYFHFCRNSERCESLHVNHRFETKCFQAEYQEYMLTYDQSTGRFKLEKFLIPNGYKCVFVKKAVIPIT